MLRSPAIKKLSPPDAIVFTRLKIWIRVITLCYCRWLLLYPCFPSFLLSCQDNKKILCSFDYFSPSTSCLIGNVTPAFDLLLLWTSVCGSTAGSLSHPAAGASGRVEQEWQKVWASINKCFLQWLTRRVSPLLGQVKALYMIHVGSYHMFDKGFKITRLCCCIEYSLACIYLTYALISGSLLLRTFHISPDNNCFNTWDMDNNLEQNQ